MSYSARLSDEKQFEISKVLCESSRKSNVPSCSNSNEPDFLVDFNLCSDFDVDSVLAELENNEFQHVRNSQPMCSAPTLSSRNTGNGFNIQKFYCKHQYFHKQTVI
jgi:hypothetical protein